MDAKDVPHFYEGGHTDSGEQINAARKWLMQRGLSIWSAVYSGNETLKNIMQSTKRLSPGVPFVLSGSGPRRVNHSVVVLDGKIVCDPATGEGNPEALVGPCKSTEDESFWWVDVIAKI